MPENVEIKAVARDPDTIGSRAEALSGSPGELLLQEDTFFHTPHGRLKLRETIQSGQRRAELIHYVRPDATGPKLSRYEVVPLADPAPLKRVLTASLGVKGVVTKQRRLYLVGQTRVHLDRVDTLGDFVELEVVVRAGQSAEQGQQIASELMAKLGIRPADLRPSAYLDHMENS
jgi:predicted adenylyl cyclase CyaB